MSHRALPLRPDLGRLEAEANELVAASPVGELTLDHARDAVARSYGLPSWTRLELAVRLTEAIRADDADAVRDLIAAHPSLLHEPARGVPSSWGPPMSHAATLGRGRLVRLLHELGARDHRWAFDRACLQGHVSVSRLLQDLGAEPEPGAVMGPAETQNGDGMAFLLEQGADVADEHGDPLAPVAMVLQTYCRNPEGKHRCLELFSRHGVVLPDTPPMAVHRGRVDLLQNHLENDPDLFARTFPHEAIYPPELGCAADASLALHGTPLAGGTLLHLCVDYGEVALLVWMLERGADPDARAAVDADGFGGHTALFGTVVSQPYRVGLYQDDGMARVLLEYGADPSVSASLRKRLRFVADEGEHVYRDVTPVTWGERFHDRSWVNPAALELIRGWRR